MSTLPQIYQLRIEEIDHQVEEAIKNDGQNIVHVSFAAYDSDEWDNPINNLNEIPLKGKVKLVYKTDPSQKPNIYISKVLKNPSWLDICVVANKLILISNEHIPTKREYLESLEDVYKEGEVFIATLGIR